MTTPTVPLPLLPTHQPLRLTPTDVTSFVQAEQCERFLRFRLAERAGQDFMDEYGVIPQRITPLLSLGGAPRAGCPHPGRAPKLVNGERHRPPAPRLLQPDPVRVSELICQRVGRPTFSPRRWHPYFRLLRPANGSWMA